MPFAVQIWNSMVSGLIPRRVLLVSWWLLMCFPAAPAAAPAFLSPDKVFQIQARARDDRHLEVLIRIAEGNYLYKNKLAFAIHPPTVKPAAFTLPAGHPKNDPVFGPTEIYRQGLRLILPIIRQDPSVESVVLTVSFQGCSDRGLCYPPIVRKIEVALPAPAGGNGSGGCAKPAASWDFRTERKASTTPTTPATPRRPCRPPWAWPSPGTSRGATTTSSPSSATAA
jgi:thiol:disulfide interchange protein